MSLNASLQATWMIKATTGATRPDFDFIVNGPTEVIVGTTANYTISGLADATYTWRFDQGNPPSASGMEGSTTWTAAGNYTVTVTGTLDGNSLPKTLNVHVYDCRGLQDLPYEEDYENGIDCWKNVDADGDGHSWEIYQTSSSWVHAGAGSAQSASYINGVGALHPDNWLISPQIHIPSTGAYIEWWEKAIYTDYAEHYSVMVSTSGDEVADFTAHVFTGNVQVPQTWTKHSRSLNDFAGRDIYIAFRHFDCTDQYWLSIDDVKIAAGTAGIDESATVDVKLFPNPVNDRLMVRAEELQEVDIIDVNGRTVLTAHEAEIDMSTLAEGVYMVRVITARGIATEKIVKQ